MQNKRIKAALAIVAGLAVPFYLIAPGKATKRQKAPFNGRNIAHRGLHSRDRQIPENSLAAFKLATEAGYGVELDVQLSKDGQVVVFHDDTLDRVCGVHARVEDLNYSELRELSLCGSGEGIPLFTDVLNIVKGRGPIICELKNGKRNKELCEKTYAIISDYSGEICIESFNPMIVAWFRFHAPDLLRGQLACTAKDYNGEVSKPASIILSNLLLNFLARPQFVAYKIGRKPLTVRIANRLGAMRFCWTSHEPRNEKGNDCVIFEFYKPGIFYK